MNTIKKLQLSRILHPKTLNALIPGILAGLFFLLPFERIPSFPVTVFGTTVDMRLSFIAGLALIGVITYGLIKKQIKISKKIRTILYWLGLFFFFYGLSVLLSADIKRAVSVWGFTFFTALVGLSVALAWQFRDTKIIRQAILASTWVVILFGFYQYFGDVFGLSTHLTGLREMYTKQIFGFPRIQSTGLEPLFYANYLLIPFFFFTVKFLDGLEEHPFLLTAIVTQIFLTVSRGAMIGGGIALILLLITHRRAKIFQRLGILGITILGVAIALLLTNINSIRPVTTTGQTVVAPAPSAVIDQATNFVAQDDRIRNRDLAIQAFREHPVLGIGPGNFSQYAKDRYEGYAKYDGYLVVNNEPLEILAEGGLLSGLGILGFVLSIILGLLKIVFRNKNDESNLWAYVLLAYFIGLSIQLQSFSTLYIMHIWVAIGVGIGLLAEENQAQKETKRSKLKKA